MKVSEYTKWHWKLPLYEDLTRADPRVDSWVLGPVMVLFCLRLRNQIVIFLSSIFSCHCQSDSIFTSSCICVFV